MSFCHRCGARLASSEGTSGIAAPVAPSLPPTDPSVVAAGRYRIIRLLGEGARKRVYLAHDTRLDREVALALVKTEGLDAEGLARIRREAQAMGRLGDHPHIVTIFDIGEEGNLTYIVSQYMEGGSVAERLGRAGGKPLPIPEALRIAEQVCQALDHSHTRGIVHRDLKPANVWLTQDGTAQLGDFGLAMAAGLPRLSVEGMMIGTVNYMAPEQATGREVGAKADLYSLGALLYEMVTGRPVFLGDDAVSVISQHLSTPPVSPSWHNSEVSPAVDALIMHLLSKAPEERPSSAGEVRQRLEHILTAPAASFSKSGSSELRAPTLAPGLNLLTFGHFVGREHEMAVLRASVEACLSGQGSLVTIAGEPGIGKSRVAEEIGVYARLRGLQVLVGRGYEGEGSPSFWPWIQALRSYVHERDPQTLLSEMGPGAADIAQMVSEVRELLPDLPPPPPLEPDQARFRLFDSVTTFLMNAGRAQPLIIVLDDLQWADKPSLLLLQFLSRELRSGRVLVIGTYRDNEVGRRHPLSEVLATLWRERRYERLRLGGLSPEEVVQLVKALAQHDLDAAGLELAAALHFETEGNPFFIEEILRHLVETGRIYRHEGRWTGDAATVGELGIAEGVREVIGRRLAQLSEECNQALQTAGVIGREFSLDVLQNVVGTTEDRLLEAIDEAVTARVIEEAAQAPGLYRFRNTLTRETLYDELPTIRRVRLHRQIAEQLERVHAARLDHHAAELAYHFQEAARGGGDRSKAVEYSRRAGDHAVASLAFEQATEHYRAAVESLDPDGDGRVRGELLLALGEARWRAGDVSGAKQTFEEAAALGRRSGEAEVLARAALGYGCGLGGFGWTDRVDETLVRLLEEALASLDEADGELRVRLLGRLATELHYSNEVERRAALGRDAVEMAGRLGEPKLRLIALYCSFAATMGPEGLEERVSGADEMLRLAARCGDREMEYLAHSFRLWNLIEQGDTGAWAELAACERLAVELRQPVYTWLTRSFQAMRALLEGRLDESEGLIEEAMRLGQASQPELALSYWGAQRITQGWIRGGLGDLLEAVAGIADRYNRLSAFSSALTLMYSALDRREEARSVFELMARGDFGGIRRDGNWLCSLTTLAFTAHYLEDTDRAAELYELMLPCAERMITATRAVCVGSAHLPLGWLASATGRFEDAARHFELARERNAAMGARPYEAWALYSHAAMLVRRDQEGDRHEALGLLARALDIASELRMKLVEQIVALKLEAQGISVPDTSVSVYAVAASVSRARPDLRAHAAPNGTVTLMFSDIEGSTALNEALGDQRWMEVLRDHNTAIRRQVALHGGSEVKSQGDGFMLAFPSARQAAKCAVAIQRTMSAIDADGRPVAVRIGLHTGEPIREGEDFFGHTVVVAARVAGAAHGGEILVTSLVKELIGTGSAGPENGEFCFGASRQIELKGLTGTHTVHPIDWELIEAR